MYRFIAVFAFGALLLSTGTEAEAQNIQFRIGNYSYGYSFGSSYRHNSYHSNLQHNDYHRSLYHRDAHRYPMTRNGHGQLHDALNHDRYHDQLQHRALHRNGYFYPTRRWGYSTRCGW